MVEKCPSILAGIGFNAFSVELGEFASAERVFEFDDEFVDADDDDDGEEEGDDREGCES